jgi:hypothetical protein
VQHGGLGIDVLTIYAGYTGTVPTDWRTDIAIQKITLEPEGDSETAASCDLLFQYTDRYPEELPNLKISNTRGLTNADGVALLDSLQAAAQDNIGMASIFAVMQAGKDWLEHKAGLEEGVISLRQARRMLADIMDVENQYHIAISTSWTLTIPVPWYATCD